jgi:HK97 family phage major capsid protein
LTKQLRERRAKQIQDAREILTRAEKEKRDLTPEEAAQWDTLHAEADKLKGHIDRLERQDDEERDLGVSDGRRTEPDRPSGGVETTASDRVEGLRAWLLMGANRQPSREQLDAARRSGIEPQRKEISLRLWTKPPRSQRDIDERAMATTQPSVDSIIPDEPMKPLEEALLAFGGMRQVATILRTSTGAPLPIPTSNETTEEGMILGENTPVSEQEVSFGQITFDAYKYSSKMIRVSVELMQDSSVNLAEFIGRKLGERIGRITNRHFTVGSGTGQPRGLVTASVLGKLAASGQTTSITVEDLIDLEHSIDPAYRTGSRYMFHDLTLKALKKLKDSQNRPLWLPGLAVREPDTILSYPYVINQHMAPMAASARSVVFGQLAKYWIRDVVDITLLRLDERFAELHQVAFLAFSRHDGDLIDAGTGPVKHLQQAAA